MDAETLKLFESMLELQRLMLEAQLTILETIAPVNLITMSVDDAGPTIQ